jgi:hypothetical protein
MLAAAPPRRAFVLLRRGLLLCLAGWLSLAPTAAQGDAAAATALPLPGVTGKLRPDASWTPLSGAALDRDARPTDPGPGLARDLLHAAIGELRREQRTGDHLLLQALGPAGQLRLVNAYAAAGSVTGDELRRDEAATRLREALEPMLRGDGITVTFAGHDDPGWFATGCLRLRFTLQREAQAWQVHYHVVPAGEQIQYFEALSFPDDTAAPTAIEAVLRSFDGARDAPSRFGLFGNMLLGGALGGALGVATARWRRRRLLRALADGPAGSART